MVKSISSNSSSDKAKRYEELLLYIRSLTADEPDQMANLSNTAAAIHQIMNFFWVGFYLVKGDDLVLGPFQGPVACTRISYGKGVCGKSWADNTIIRVADVHTFPGHISCHPDSKSEIVIPIRSGNQVVAVLDVDSIHIDDFDQIDEDGLASIGEWVGNTILLDPQK